MSRVLISYINSTFIPKIVIKTLNHPDWCNTMLEQINDLDDNQTWDLIDLAKWRKVVGYKWVFTVEVNANGSVAELKALLVAKGYT